MSAFATPPKIFRNEARSTLFDCLSGEDESRPLVAQPVLRPDPNATKDAMCVVLEDVLTPIECQAVIERTEATGFAPALLNVGGGREIYAPDTRNSDRVIIDDGGFARRIFDRIKEGLPWTQVTLGDHATFDATGLNERMRVLRYGPGNDFKMHRDGSYRRPDGSEVSFWTVMIYLNGGYSGGSTLFYSDDGVTSTPVIPKAGMVLVFDHGLLHEGQEDNREQSMLFEQMSCLRHDVNVVHIGQRMFAQLLPK
jgi:hypothetical protein